MTLTIVEIDTAGGTLSDRSIGTGSGAAVFTIAAVAFVIGAYKKDNSSEMQKFGYTCIQFEVGAA